MKSQARVVVVGGGIFGVSVLYHLAKEGWSDVVLLEKGELTSGTTWHAAGQCPHFVGDLNLARIHDYGINLYKGLEAETGQATGWHTSGGIRLARNREELDWHRHVASIARQAGIESHVIGLDEIRKLHPFLQLDEVVAGTYTPHDGHTDPTSSTNAMAIAARKLGATIYKHVKVTGFQRQGDEWEVQSEKGSIRCEHVVLATGFYSDQVGDWLGLSMPLINVVHQYLVTDPVPELLNRPGELPVVRDPRSSAYMRQEQKGLLGGPYETKGLHTAYDDGVPWSFDMELLEPDLERISPWLELMMKRLPLFEKVGVRRVISGFIAHTPDLTPLVGPAPGPKNVWMACGSTTGIAQGPGCGKYLAQWIVNGSAEISMLPFDPRRYGRVHTPAWVRSRTLESSTHMYDLHPPGYLYHEGRPLRTSPIYDRLKKKGAVFAESMGWERARWFAPEGVEERYSFRRNNSFDAVARECHAVRTGVGVLDLTTFSKFEIVGQDAESYLNRILANRIPGRDGGVTLCHLLNEQGTIDAEVTVTRLSADNFFVLSAGAMQARDFDQLTKARLDGERVNLRDVTESYGCLVVTGPKSRTLLQALTKSDLANASFRWMTAQPIAVAGVPLRALRVSYAGELGWELYMPIENMAAVYDALIDKGASLGIADFGMYALNSLRIEKAYRGFGGELTNELSPIEADMERFIAYDKGEFTGRAALLSRKQQGVQWKLVYVEIKDTDRDVIGSEAVYDGERIVGIVTSGGYGHSVRKTLAFAYVDPQYDTPGTRLDVMMLGDRYAAVVLDGPVYDPRNERMRA